MAELFASFARVWPPRKEEGVLMYQHTILDSLYGVLSFSPQRSPGRKSFPALRYRWEIQAQR